MTSRIKALGYRVFYGLPRGVRSRLVRLGSPTYTVGAVVLLRDPDGRLLLLRQPPGSGWSLPGGLIGRRERPRDCAVRELAEETAIRLDRDAVTPASPNAVVHTKGRWVDLVFCASLTSLEAARETRVDGAEVLEARWFAERSLPPLTVPTARLLAHYGVGPYAEYPEVTA